MLFLHMVTRSWARLHSLHPSRSKDITLVSNSYRKALINVRWFLIIKVQQNWSLCSARIIRFSVFSHCKMAHRYHIKMATCFTAAAWLGMDLWVYCLIQLYKQHTVLWYQQHLRFNLATYIFTCWFPSSTVQLLNEFYFALSTFQVSGKQIHDHDIEVPAALFWIGSMVVTHVPDWLLTRSLWGTFFLRHSGFFHGGGRIMLSCEHLVYI